MIRVADILPEARKIVGHHDLAVVFRQITKAVELLANKGDFDPLVGVLDICTSGRIVTLPSEVETILGVNILGEPAVGRDELFQFHINGPGICGPQVGYEWLHMQESPVFRDITCPAKIYGYATVPEDAGVQVWVFGYDSAGNFIRTEVAPGEYRDGWPAPIFFGAAGTVESAPLFARVTAVVKPVTRAPIKLVMLAPEGEVVIGVYQSYETLPKFRRIQLSEAAPWVRIHFRRRTFAVQSEYDLIPLDSSVALLTMLRALRAYESGDVPLGEAYEATATRWLLEEQRTKNAPVVHPIQVHDGAVLLPASEYMI